VRELVLDINEENGDGASSAKPTVSRLEWRNLEFRSLSACCTYQSIAGTEVAKEASNVILMDDNFYSTVRAFMFLSTVPV
jgi:magnesium-transporting ATPase (P-type)